MVGRETRFSSTPKTLILSTIRTRCWRRSRKSSYTAASTRKSTRSARALRASSTWWRPMSCLESCAQILRKPRPWTSSSPSWVTQLWAEALPITLNTWAPCTWARWMRRQGSAVLLVLPMISSIRWKATLASSVSAPSQSVQSHLQRLIIASPLRPKTNSTNPKRFSWTRKRMVVRCQYRTAKMPQIWKFEPMKTSPAAVGLINLVKDSMLSIRTRANSVLSLSSCPRTRLWERSASRVMMLSQKYKVLAVSTSETQDIFYSEIGSDGFTLTKI